MAKNNGIRLGDHVKKIKRDGLDTEFSKELADQDDLEAQARSRQADKRQR